MKRAVFLIGLLLLLGVVSRARAQQQPNTLDKGELVLLGGFDVSNNSDGSFTRIDPTADVLVGSGVALGARLIHETGYGGINSRSRLWGVGPKASYFPFATRPLTWIAGRTDPYVHAGTMHTWRAEDHQVRSSNPDTERGWTFYGGVGLTHEVFGGVGVFLEANVARGFSYQSPAQPGDFRFGLSVTVR
jgi:hypothetical protein